MGPELKETEALARGESRSSKDSVITGTAKFEDFTEAVPQDRESLIT